MTHEQATPAERVPRAPARRARRRAAGRSRPWRGPSSCTASPASRPAPSSRSTSCCARGRPPRRSTSCAGSRTPTPAATPASGLHFDLTVPFARYVLENAGKLEFPFRRYQIQKVWRGERPQEGRFREFTQADIDVVGRDELPFHHDVEVARVMLDALGRAATSLPGLRLQVNNRKLIQGFYAGLGARRHRRGDARRRQARQARAGAGPHAAGRRGRADRGAGRPVPGAGRDRHHRRLVRRAGARARRRARPARRGPRRAGRGGRAAARRWRPTGSGSWPTCPIARGLDYYTGTVFETRLDGFESLGLDLLRRPLRRARQRRPDDVPRRGHLARASAGCWCRWSSAAWSAADRLGARAPSSSRWSTRSRAAASDADRHRSCARAASRARSPPSPQKFGKQIRYAERRGIPFVLVPAADGRPRGQGHPQRGAGRRRPGRLDPARRGPAPAGRRPTGQQGADRDPHP